MSQWTQAICEACWYKRFQHEPVRMKKPPTEVCCDCGQDTQSGIYFRADPTKVEYPKQ